MDSRTETICKRVWAAIGHVGYDVRQPWNYCAVQPENDGKHNYSVKQWLPKAGDCVKHLKDCFTLKYVQSAYGRIYFWIDDYLIIAQVDREIAEAKAKRIAELNAIDLRAYVPTQKVLDKLTGYFDKGSKVNVKAIADGKKLLTYYYAAALLGWGELKWDIDSVTGFCGDWYHWKDANGVEIEQIIKAIDLRVKTDPAIQLSRDKQEDALLSFSKKIWQAVKNSGLEFEYKTVPTTYDECWKDHKNGCAWTIAKFLRVGTESVRFSIVTNEACDAPNFGYQTRPIPGCLMNKGELEDEVLYSLNLA